MNLSNHSRYAIPSSSACAVSTEYSRARIEAKCISATSPIFTVPRTSSSVGSVDGIWIVLKVRPPIFGMNGNSPRTSEAYRRFAASSTSSAAGEICQPGAPQHLASAPNTFSNSARAFENSASISVSRMANR